MIALFVANAGAQLHVCGQHEAPTHRLTFGYLEQATPCFTCAVFFQENKRKKTLVLLGIYAMEFLVFVSIVPWGAPLESSHTLTRTVSFVLGVRSVLHVTASALLCYRANNR